jgi:hypothetical protein
VPQSMPNAAQPAVGLSVHRSSTDHPIARPSLVFRSSLARFSLALPSASAHPTRKYFRIKCVDDFHFRSKYIAATCDRATPYPFEKTIESRKQLQNQTHSSVSKKRGPIESNTCIGINIVDSSG